MTRRGLVQSLLALIGLASPSSSFAAERLSYADSCRRLMTLGFIDGPDVPPMPTRTPRYDDAAPGVSFFRQLIENADLSDLTLPRTYFDRSDIKAVSFRNTDLNHSNLCWNNFIKTDFSSGSLAGGDLRSSLFFRCRFNQADLRGADLRRSQFEYCDFAGASLAGAIATRGQLFSGPLSDEQSAMIDWRDDEGPEPDGG